MKHTYILSTATALVLGLSGIAWAGAPVEVDCNVNGNANWSYEKLVKQIINRISNAGIGNGGELFWAQVPPSGEPVFLCGMGFDGEEPYDHDPGNSYAHNANN